jgi:hypothetical protein
LPSLRTVEVEAVGAMISWDSLVEAAPMLAD